MSKIFQRLTVFFIGIPVVLGFVIPEFFNHLTLHCLILFIAFVACLELTNMLRVKSETLPKPLLEILSLDLPLMSYFCGLFNIDFIFIDAVLAVNILVIFIYEVFSKKDFSNSNSSIASSIMIIIYSGFLPTFISRMCVLNYSTQLVCLFLIFVFISDSAAWLFGMLFGKNNRGLIAASPNKSIAGFIGAFLGTILICVLLRYVFWKEIFGTAGFYKLLLLAFCVTVSSIIGDLAESVFKRSCGFKDSGNIILGRGGVLDSIDSIFASAPLFYIIAKYIF